MKSVQKIAKIGRYTMSGQPGKKGSGGMKGLWEFFSSACTGWEHAKTFSEESTELLGYAFMFISGIAYLCELAAEKRQSPD